MGRNAFLLLVGSLVAALSLARPGQAQLSSPLQGSTAQVRPDTLFLTLGEAVARALRDSEEMAAARATLAQAEAQITQAVAGALPQVSSNLVYNRAIRTIFDAAAAPPPLPDSLIPPAFDPEKPPEERFDLLSGLLIRDFIGSLFRGLPFGRRNTYIATFSFSQPLYVGGKVGAALRVARHFQAAAKAQMEETQAEIILQTREAYLNAALAQRLVAIARESRRIAEEHFRQVESFYQAGTASEFDLLRARVDLQNRDPVVTQAENNANLALLELKRLINLPPSQPIKLQSDLRPLPVSVEEDELRRLVRERPALAAVRQNVAIREEAVRIARADLRPTVALVGTLGFQGYPDNPLPPSLDSWRKDWSVGLALSVPIFDGFRTRGRVDQALADLNLARVEEARLSEGLELQLEAALAQYRLVRVDLEARRQTVVLAERTLELAEARFGSGLGTQLEVSDAALLLDQARLNEVQALYDYLRVLARLERLSGGRLDLLGRAEAEPVSH